MQHKRFRIPAIFRFFISRQVIVTATALVALLLTLAVPFAVRPAYAATTWTVTGLGDSGGPCSGTNCTTLRAAMTAAMSDSGDTIIFSVSGTIILNAALPNVFKALTISGLGQNVTISGNNSVGVFSTTSGGTLTLQNITVTKANNSRGVEWTTNLAH